jgi:hypothetical protein
MTETLLPTSLVGSYAQPNWLIDRKRLAERFPPRVRARHAGARSFAILAFVDLNQCHLTLGFAIL